MRHWTVLLLTSTLWWGACASPAASGGGAAHATAARAGADGAHAADTGPGGDITAPDIASPDTAHGDALPPADAAPPDAAPDDAAPEDAAPSEDAAPTVGDASVALDASDAVEAPLDAGSDAGPACVRACAGKACGPDGCGGTCGVCLGCNGPAPSLCYDGLCATPCCPDCTGKQCGSDGCAGACGTCPTGSICQAGTCAPTTCTPACAGKACGPNGCGGTCGTCGAGLVCDAGACVTGPCAPSCTGKTCGPDGCDGSCGTCAAGETCTPDQQCVNAVGCSDGARDELADIAHWPLVAACAGTFGPSSLRAARTGTACGDDLGVPCPVPEDLCAVGWHICMRDGRSTDLRFRLTSAECKALTQPYVAATNNCSNGPDEAPGAVGCNTTEPYGCYPTGWCSAPPACGPTETSQCPHAIWPNGTRIFGLHAGKTDNAGCAHISTEVSYPGQGKLAGILCCRDGL